MSEIKQHPNHENLERLGEFVDDVRERSRIVGEIQHLEPVDIEFGTTHRYGFQTEAGYLYAANVTIPHKQTTDISVLSTGAWGTSTRGHNENTGADLAELGIPFIHVGNEGSYHPWGIPPIPKRGLTLVGSAGAALAFSEEVTKRDFPYLLHPELRTAIGESKGGMEGMALPTLASAFGQKILMADFTATCMPKKPSIKELFQFGDQLVRGETIGAARLAGRLAVDVLAHMPSTIDLNPYAFAHQVAKGPAIFSGEAGDLSRLLDENFVLHKTIFKGDGWSMVEEWVKIFGGSSNVRINQLDGIHLTIADPETKTFVMSRQMAFRDLYEQNDRRQQDQDGNELFSGQDIWNLAHEYYNQCAKALPGGMIQTVIRLAVGGNNRLHRDLTEPKAA